VVVCEIGLRIYWFKQEYFLSLVAMLRNAGNGQAPVWPPEMILRCIDDGCTSCCEKSKSYGPQSPTVARDLNNLAELLCKANRMIDAEPTAVGLSDEKILSCGRRQLQKFVRRLIGR